MNILEHRWRLLSAGFLDSGRGDAWKQRLETDLPEALEVLLYALAHDMARLPKDIDNEYIRRLLTHVLPGRLAGNESYCAGLLDLLEEFLLFVAEEEGLALQWEWVSALGEHRGAFERTLADPDRPILAPPAHEPDRRPAAKLSRNDPCPCGSGKKYKHCCLRLQ